MQAVWMVRSRQIARKLAWWLALIGYDPHDHTLNHRIYLVYASIFWSCWLFAVFSLFAGPTLTVLKALDIFPLDQAAALLVTLVLAAWGLYRLWQATRGSPFVFSEEDAHLICQAPVPGSTVALAWFLGDWFEPAAPFWAAAVTLSIALVDFRLENKVTITDLPVYITFGLQALVMVALAQIGLMALVWAAGALRLQRDRQLTFQPTVVRVGIFAVVSVMIYFLINDGLAGLGLLFFQVAFSPIYFTARAAFGIAPLAVGLLVGLAWAGVGLVALAWSGANLNLSRAAQETTQKEKIETALRYGQNELAAHVALSNRLGSGHSPTRLPAKSGLWILGWKDVLQSMRAVRFSDAWSWLMLFAVALGLSYIADPGGRGLALAIWTVMAGQHITARLQNDLAYWSLLRPLPFSSGRLLVAELLLPWVLVVLLGLAVLALAGGTWLEALRLPAALLLVSTSASASLAMAYDLLRQAQSSMLLNGNAPQISAVGGFLGIICLALPLGVWFGLSQFKLDGSLPAAVLAALLGLLFWNLSKDRLQRME